MMVRRPAESEALDPVDAASVAQSLREDFIALIAIFDGRRMNAVQCDEALPNIDDARLAAERGLKLSEKLIALLRSSA